MKRTILIEILLVFIFCTLMALIVKNCIWFENNLKNLKYVYVDKNALKEATNAFIMSALPYIILNALACLADIAAIILIAIKDFPAFQPLLNKLAFRKETRTKAKMEKIKAAKQSKIEELQAQLDELKKD